MMQFDRHRRLGQNPKTPLNKITIIFFCNSAWISLSEFRNIKYPNLSIQKGEIVESCWYICSLQFSGYLSLILWVSCNISFLLKSKHASHSLFWLCSISNDVFLFFWLLQPVPRQMSSQSSTYAFMFLVRLSIKFYVKCLWVSSKVLG